MILALDALLAEAQWAHCGSLYVTLRIKTPFINELRLTEGSKWQGSWRKELS